MDRNDVMALIDKSEHLAHYRTPGSKNGVRRYQYEDGSLTPEGRIHYGLNPKYASLTDDDIRTAKKHKEYEDRYVRAVTKGTVKKQENISGLIKDTAKAAKPISQLGTTFTIDRDISDLEAEKKRLTNEKNDIDKLKGISKEAKEASKAEKQKEIDFMQYGIDYSNAKKNVINNVINTTETNSDAIGKAVTKGELKRESQEAYAKVQEMDVNSLKSLVERMELEKDYEALVNPPKASAYDRGREIIQTIGAVAGVAATITSIVLPIIKLKQKEVAHSDMEIDVEFLAHYRTPGSKNGVRRYQNEDGSLTPEGYRHYGINPNGRKAADPKELAARQRAQVKLQQTQMRQQNRQLRFDARQQAKQRAYTQKIQQRAALRDARNQAQIQNVYARQQLREQRAQNQEENRARAENRANTRKNIVKGVLGVAAIGAAIGVGYHVLHNRSLDLKHVRDVDMINRTHKNEMEKVLLQAKETRYKNELDFKQALHESDNDVKKTQLWTDADRAKSRDEVEKTQINARKEVETERVKGINKVNEIREQGIANVNLKTIEGQNAVNELDAKGRFVISEAEAKTMILNTEAEKEVAIENAARHRKEYEALQKRLAEEAKYNAEAAENRGKLSILGKQETLRNTEKEAKMAIKKMQEQWKADHPEEWTLLQTLKSLKGSNNTVTINGITYEGDKINGIVKDITKDGRKGINSLTSDQLSKLIDKIREMYPGK